MIRDHSSWVEDDLTEWSVQESGDQVQCAPMKVSQSDDMLDHVERLDHFGETESISW